MEHTKPFAQAEANDKIHRLEAINAELLMACKMVLNRYTLQYQDQEQVQQAINRAEGN